MIVLDANVVVTAGERSEVECGLVWLPVVDHECAVYPYADAVVADRSQRVFAGCEVDGAGGFEGEILPRQAWHCAVALVVESRNVRSENWRRELERLESVFVFARIIGAVGPLVELSCPIDARFEPAV